MGIVDNDYYWMQQALLLADQAAQHNEVPVGAIVVVNNSIIGRGYNQPILGCDPTAHAEIIALREAAKTVSNYRLMNATLYVTLEPCAMCAGAIVHARVNRLVYGALEPKSGVVKSKQLFFEQPFLNHKVEVLGGVLADDCAKRLQDFFRLRREQKNNNNNDGA